MAPSTCANPWLVGWSHPMQNLLSSRLSFGIVYDAHVQRSRPLDAHPSAKPGSHRDTTQEVRTTASRHCPKSHIQMNLPHPTRSAGKCRVQHVFRIAHAT
jgi:hypothetical protein